MDADDRWAVHVPLAEDSTSMRLVSLVCALAPCPMLDPGTWEFSYEIRIDDLDGIDQAFTTQDRDIVKEYLPEVIRRQVPLIMLDCLDVLIRHVWPHSLYRVTKGRNLPAAAMRKHESVTDALARSGYPVVETGKDPYGRIFWLHRR